MECIGIAGSGPSVGVTHFACMAASYLSGVLRCRTAVLEYNQNGTFAQLEKIYPGGKRQENMVMSQGRNPFMVGEVFFYKEAGNEALYDCSERGIEVAVVDFGRWREENQDSFFKCGRRFMVGSASAWQLAAFAGLVSEHRKEVRGCEYFVSFGEDESVKMTEQYLNIRIRRIPPQKNALIVTGESITFFGKFLR